MAFYIIGLIIGIMIFAGGVAYLVKEKHDREARKIYTVVSVLGALIVLGVAAKMVFGG